jgi:hypothetical protein
VVGVPVPSEVDRGFNPSSGLIKCYAIGISCVFA